MTDSTQTLKMLVELTTSLNKAKFFDVSQALLKLSEHEIQELDEAVRLVRGFVNNSQNHFKTIFD